MKRTNKTRKCNCEWIDGERAIPHMDCKVHGKEVRRLYKALLKQSRDV